MGSEIMVTYVKPMLKLSDLQKEMREICKFDHQQPFTMKWIDEEGRLDNINDIFSSVR